MNDREVTRQRIVVECSKVWDAGRIPAPGRGELARRPRCSGVSEFGLEDLADWLGRVLPG